MASPEAVRVFISYSHRDQRYLDELQKHLEALELQGLIKVSHDGNLAAGTDWSRALGEYLDSSEIILMLVSANYLASGFATAEMGRALERAEQGTVRVIPILVAPCAWQYTPLAKFQIVPAGAKPVSTFRQRSKAWVMVADAIREVALQLRTAGSAPSVPTVRPAPPPPRGSGRNVNDYRLSSEVARILRVAAGLQPSQSDITTEAILAATVVHGMTERKTSAFFPGILSAEAIREQFPGTYEYKDGSPAKARLTLNATRLMDHALTTAVATTGTGWISLRHLVFALLHPIDAVKDSLLAGQGVEATKALAAYVDYLRENLPLRHELPAWESLLKRTRGTRFTTAFAPSYTADQAQGTDLLGFENDARALASLIAARETKPPLSVGLFGDWGSGKSFFMRQIREFVARIAESTRGSKNATVYHTNIVQIEFNAWHYIEGNLWASLVEHIFSNLRLRPDDTSEDAEVQKRRDELLRLLQVEQEQQEQARRKSEEAKAAAERARQERSQKIEDRVRLELVRTNDWSAALDERTLDRIGLSQEMLEKIGKLRDQGRVSWAVVGRLVATMRLLWERSRGRTLLLALGLPLAVVALGFAARWLAGKYLDPSFIREVVTLVVGAGTVIASRLAPLLAGVEGITRTVERKHRELELRRQKEAIAVDEEIVALSRRVELAGSEESQVAQRIAAIEKELDATTATRTFETFIEDRANSTDYRRHLGVLANVRRDFERMARLIEQRRDDTTLPARIVLYIDDLDRCPAKRVVAVLQAIHLLLAFPLFVVVVGVDARWIARSLQLEYSELLSALADGQEDSLGIEATPHDYLEKIFQVPFWIRAMSPADCERLIDGLTKPEPVMPLKAAADPGTPPPDAPETKPAVAASEQPEEAPFPSIAVAKDNVESEPRTDDLNPFALHVLQQEIDLMKRLTSLLGRSPRAVKRFINCYRLIKIGLDPAEIGAFLTDPQSGLHYKPVMFLLAMITGIPELGENVLDVLVEEDEKAIEAVSVDGLLQLLAAAMGDHFTAQRLIVANALLAESALDEDAFRPAALRKAALIVRRYSFRAGYATATRRERTETAKREPRPAGTGVAEAREVPSS